MAVSSSSIPATGSADAQRNQRYVYLVGRLNNRQMTMEEATELFSMMQGMLRQSEAARLAMARAVPPPPPTGGKERPPSGPAPAGGGSDDFFLLGILAMGAGAGLLAAMSKRLQDLTPVSPSAPSSASRGNSTTR
jgi:hypothetical protein